MLSSCEGLAVLYHAEPAGRYQDSKSLHDLEVLPPFFPEYLTVPVPATLDLAKKSNKS